jgi:hypothetical protein
MNKLIKIRLNGFIFTIRLLDSNLSNFKRNHYPIENKLKRPSDCHHNPKLNDIIIVCLYVLTSQLQNIEHLNPKTYYPSIKKQGK